MERNGRGVRTGGSDQLPTLKVCQCALDSASRETGGGGDRLMGHAYGPVSVLRCLTIEIEVNDER
jgi:hypothetical protein